MEYCFNTNIDILGTFKALTPYIMGFIVFIIWHWQKGKEVIANEAKLLTYDLLAIKKIVIEIENIDVKDVNKLYIEYKSLCAQIENKINFLDTDLITNNNIYKLNNYIEGKDNLLNKIKKYNDKKTESNLGDFLLYIGIVTSREDNYIKEFKKSIDEIIYISKRLSLYKKV
jgi:hypothetical protein